MNKKDKRTEKLREEEISLLKQKAEEAKNFSQFSVELGIERVVLGNTIMRGSADPSTVRKIRKQLRKFELTAA